MLDTLTVTQLWYTAGWTMLHFFWVGAALGCVAFAGHVMLRRATANARYFFALASLAALTVAPGAIALRVLDATATRTESADLGTRHLRDIPTSGVASDESISTAASVSSSVSGQAAAVVSDSRFGTVLAGIRRAVDTLARWLPCLWLALSPLALLRVTTGLVGAERLRRQSRPVQDTEFEYRCRQLVETLRTRCRVAVAACDRISGPVLVGIVRPVILVPPAALTGWSPEQVEMVLLHELAHVRRWDNLVNLLQRVTESLLFFHPAVWLVSNWVRRERERCCDEFVVSRTGDRPAYAELLASFAIPSGAAEGELRKITARCQAATSSMARADCLSRVRHILRKGDEPMQVSRKAFGGVLLAVVAALTLIGWCTCPSLVAVGAEAPETPAAADSTSDLAAAQDGGRQSTQTYLTAIINENGQRKAWLLTRDTGTRVVVTIGDPVRVHGTVFVVSEMDTDWITLSSPSAKNLKVRLGDALSLAASNPVPKTQQKQRVGESYSSAMSRGGAESGWPTNSRVRNITRDGAILLEGCRVKYINEVALASGRNGILASVSVREGDIVTAGQEVARLRDDAERADVAMAEARAANDVSIRYALKSSEVADKECETAVAANKQLPGSVTQVQMGRLRQAVAQARLAIELAEHNLKLDQLARDKATAALHSCSVKTPFDGVVRRVEKSAGEAVREGEKILEIVNTKRIRVEGYIDFRDRAVVKPGDLVTVQPSVEAGATRDRAQNDLEGRIVFVDVSVAAVLSKIRVWAEVANGEDAIVGGLPVTMTIHAKNNKTP